MMNGWMDGWIYVVHIVSVVLFHKKNKCSINFSMKVTDEL